MNKSKFLDTGAVIKSLLAVLLGVFLYCVAVAPFFEDGSLLDIWKDKLLHNFLGWAAAIVVVGAVWIAVIYFKEHRPSK